MNGVSGYSWLLPGFFYFFPYSYFNCFFGQIFISKTKLSTIRTLLLGLISNLKYAFLIPVSYAQQIHARGQSL